MRLKRVQVLARWPLRYPRFELGVVRQKLWRKAEQQARDQQDGRRAEPSGVGEDYGHDEDVLEPCHSHQTAENPKAEPTEGRNWSVRPPQIEKGCDAKNREGMR